MSMLRSDKSLRCMDENGVCCEKNKLCHSLFVVHKDKLVQYLDLLNAC